LQEVHVIVYKNLDGIYDSKEFYSINPDDDSPYKEDAFCGSFGHFTYEGNDYLALAVGSMVFIGDQDGELFEKLRWGNDIYILNDLTNPKYLIHVGRSEVDETNPNYRAQSVTDIQWAYLGGFGDNNMDLAAVAYPAYAGNYPNYYWDRGLEQIHINPELSVEPGYEKFETEIWTTNPDLSTSMALGDIDYNVGQSLEPVIHIVSHQIPYPHLIYVDKFPFIQLQRVDFIENGQPSPIASWVWNDIGNSDFKVAYDALNGWIMIEANYNPPEDWDEIRYSYLYSSNFDLAVGNDGRNVVYYCNSDGGENNPQAYSFIPDLPPYSEPITYIEPQELINNDANLMGEDCIGYTGEYNFYPLDVEPYIAESINRFGLCCDWGLIEIFRGHYFWDYLDRSFETIRSKGANTHLCFWHTNMWTMGNYDPINPADKKARTSDERLHTMTMRNLVNRYRPGGFFDTQNNMGYDWGTGEDAAWGAEIFQTSYEANCGARGYGEEPDAVHDMAEQMYRAYQMIKAISENEYTDDHKLKVVSPTFKSKGFHPEDDLYTCPPMPYLNDLNDEPFYLPDNPAYPVERILWKYVDFISQQIHCSIEYGGDFTNYRDPFNPVYAGDEPPYDNLCIGYEHNFWGYYTEGLAYYINGDLEPWRPVMYDSETGVYYEHPFFMNDIFQCSNYVKTTEGDPFSEDLVIDDWTAAHIAELFSVDVFPLDTDINHFLVQYYPNRIPLRHYDTYEVCAQMLNVPNITFDSYKMTQVGDAIVHSYTYFQPEGSGGSNDPAYVHFIRTDQGETYTYEAEQFVQTPFDFDDLMLENYQEGAKVECYTPDSDHYQKEVDVSGSNPVVGFNAGEMGPGMVVMHESSSEAQLDYTQSIQLHNKWNLLSWHIWPIGQLGFEFTISDILPNDPEHSWFHDQPGGKVYDYTDDYEYWPQFSSVGNRVWNVNWAYYFHMDGSHNWDEFTERPEYWTSSTGFQITPSDDWAENENVSSPYASYWFFMGYGAPGYCKLSSIPGNGYSPTCGDPATFDYEGPFHDLIWHNTEPFDLWDLKIVKDDEGRVYIPDPDPDQHRRPPYDNIGTLGPGKGYFLGFSNDESYHFDGWSNWPQWQNENIVPSDPKSNPNQTASGSHFQYNKYTHWSYPVYIDTVDLEECPMAAGDEIGVFDGSRCVGAAVYQGEFPLIVVCWEDDKATPMELDGYIPFNPMAFIWYDASENAEIEFELPPQVQAVQDDPVAPEHSGFGCGLYARRQFTNGIAQVTQLPNEYKMGQNYPNPFNSVTLIPLELPQRSKVKLEIFNIQGQVLGMPYETIYDAGWSKIKWDASKLPSGVYFYRITAEGLEHTGQFQEAGKMLLLK